MDGGHILEYARSEFLSMLSLVITVDDNVPDDSFFIAGHHILLLQKSYIHFDSVLVHLSNWFLWSKILR